MAPLYHELSRHSEIDIVVVHTGQHYDKDLYNVFYSQFDLPRPHYDLNVRKGDPCDRVGAIISGMASVLKKEDPDYVVVFGDVDSTFAAAVAARRGGIKLIHIEAGLRSFDLSMPEEMNRILVDRMSDMLFITEESGMKNLQAEGISEDKCHLVGNILIDAMDQFGFLKKGPMEEPFILWTIHRPSNVDEKSELQKVLDLLKVALDHCCVIWPVHPRTEKALKALETDQDWSDLRHDDRLKLLKPEGYKQFTNLLASSSVVVTDSGGVQEEACYLGVPCLTLRNNTERPSTVEAGANSLIYEKDKVLFEESLRRAIVSEGSWDIPPLWDGKTSRRTVEIILKSINTEVSNSYL